MTYLATETSLSVNSLIEVRVSALNADNGWGLGSDLNIAGALIEGEPL
jgi:hypothetical protein